MKVKYYYNHFIETQNYPSKLNVYVCGEEGGKISLAIGNELLVNVIRIGSQLGSLFVYISWLGNKNLRPSDIYSDIYNKLISAMIISAQQVHDVLNCFYVYMNFPFHPDNLV